MPLCITTSSDPDLGYKPGSNFWNMAYAMYLVLIPVFDEAAKESGVKLDFYGGARYEGTSLDALIKALEGQRNVVWKFDDVQRVKIGVETTPDGVVRELWASIERRDIEDAVSKILKLAIFAKSTNQALVCIAD